MDSVRDSLLGYSATLEVLLGVPSERIIAYVKAASAVVSTTVLTISQARAEQVLGRLQSLSDAQIPYLFGGAAASWSIPPRLATSPLPIPALPPGPPAISLSLAVVPPVPPYPVEHSARESTIEPLRAFEGEELHVVISDAILIGAVGCIICLPIVFINYRLWVQWRRASRPRGGVTPAQVIVPPKPGIAAPMPQPTLEFVGWRHTKKNRRSSMQPQSAVHNVHDRTYSQPDSRSSRILPPMTHSLPVPAASAFAGPEPVLAAGLSQTTRSFSGSKGLAKRCPQPSRSPRVTLASPMVRRVPAVFVRSPPVLPIGISWSTRPLASSKGLAQQVSLPDMGPLPRRPTSSAQVAVEVALPSAMLSSLFDGPRNSSSR